MKTKDAVLKMFCRTERHKREESGEKGHIPHHTFFVMSLAAAICFMLLFAGMGMASATTVYVSTDGSGDYNCDGVDDEVEINQAINYINSLGGGTVHLKAGTYVIDNYVSLKSGVTLEGVNNSSAIIKLEDHNPRTPGHRVVNINADNVILQDFAIDGNKDNQDWGVNHGADGINFAADSITIRRIYIYDVAQDGIVGGGNNCNISHNYLKDTGHDALRFGYGLQNSHIEYNKVDGYGSHGIRYNNANYNTISHNEIVQTGIVSGDYAMEIVQYGTGSAINLEISYNIIRHGTYSGITLSSDDANKAKDYIIKNNVFYHCGYKYGHSTIDFLGPYKNILIENNVITDGYKDGIETVAGCSNITVKNNIIAGNGKGLGGGYGINGPGMTSTYNNIYDNADGSYGGGASSGTGDISVDPLFANAVEGDYLAVGDYHLKSEHGRWDGTCFVQDDETSLCIGAGDLNGEKINMGAYGNMAEASLTSDVTPIYPTITQHSPTGTAAPVETTLKVTFNKAMNTVSAEGAFSISPDVPGTFSWNGNNEMIFTPDSDLDYERTYTVTLNREAEDLEGSNMQSLFDWQFTTLTSGVDLIGDWHFEEGSGEIAEDTSVNTNDGTLTNMDPASAWVAGKPGTALQFDGIDDYVDCGNDASLDITDAITIETWIKPNVAGEGGPNAGPVCKAEAEVDWSWQLKYNAPGGYMGFQFNGDPEDSTWVSVNQNLAPDEWYHIAGTFDGTTLKCYLNGVETDTNHLSAIKSGNARLFIGQDGWGHIFNGVVDEVKIYNRALSAEEIKADYDVVSPVGEWHFEEGSGEIAEDTSVNNNEGTLTNMDPATAWVAGKPGTALQFDGLDDYVDCGNDASLDITDAITIETWIKPNVAGEGGTNTGPVCKAEAEVDWSWQLRYNAPDGYMGFQFNGDPEDSTWVSVNQNLTSGEWYHVASTFDGTTLRCYLNGVETDTNHLSAIKGGNARLFIGQDGWGHIFNGVVDEVTIYNRALSADEIQADYEAGLVYTSNSLTGTVTTSTQIGIANATVTLATLEGDVINTTQTNSIGNYEFADIAPGDYNLTATKPRFWYNFSVITVNASVPTTADILLYMKGDFNNNGESADAGDLAMMEDAKGNVFTPDETYDLNGDGNLADEDDLRLLKDVSLGVAELE